MQTAELFYCWQGINTNYLSARETGTNGIKRNVIIFILIEGNKHGLIDYQKMYEMGSTWFLNEVQEQDGLHLSGIQTGGESINPIPGSQG